HDLRHDGDGELPDREDLRADSEGRRSPGPAQDAALLRGSAVLALQREASLERRIVIRSGQMLLLAAALSAGAQSGPAPSGRYDDLVAFFREWRALPKPQPGDRVPGPPPPAVRRRPAG